MKFNLHKPISAVVMLCAIYLCACKKDVVDKTRPDNEVWLQNYVFVPSVLTIKAGTTVTWRNKDADNHTVTSDPPGILNSPTMHSGDVFTYTFSTPGTYPYICVFHAPDMAGTIIVQ